MIKKDITELTRTTVAEYREAEKARVCLVADNVRSQHNVGAMLRTADALRIAEVHLCGISPAPPHPDIHKTALGAEESVAWRAWPDTVRALCRLKDEGWTLCALEQAHGSVPLHLFRPPRDAKIALVAGNEVEGVGEEALYLCDHIFEIPQFGTKHSLNVSVSVGMALYQLVILDGL